MSRATTQTPRPAPGVAPAARAFSAGVRATRVEPGSIAEGSGLAPGDYLQARNGHPVQDVIDYWLHRAAERLKVQWRAGGPDGCERSRTVRKAYHEGLGLEVEPFECRRCSNYCVLCFVPQ